MTTRVNLRLTGPIPMPDEVRAAVSRQVVSHRSDAFRVLLRAVVGRLQTLLEAEIPPIPFTTSGTGGLEAAIVNTISRGDRVLSVSIGAFGERFADIARAFGAEVIPWSLAWGEAADPALLAARLGQLRDVRAVLLTHNESSTGVLNPLPALAAAVHASSDALVLVDGVSSVAAMPVRMRSWGLDVVVTASQKALMSPPGIAVVALSPRALEVASRCATPRYYLDVARMLDSIAEGTTKFTPALATLYGLDAALSLIEDEGREEVYARHERTAEACRRGLAGLGLTMFAPEGRGSPTVTSVLLPEGRSAGEIRARLEAEHHVFVSQGRGALKDRLLRIGHMGRVDPGDIDHLVDAARAVLAR